MTYNIHYRTPEEVIYDHEEGAYTIWRHLEFIGGEWRTYVHCVVYYWSPRIMKHMIATFDEVRATLPPVIGAQNWVPDDKARRFMSNFGFEPIAEIEWNDGVRRPLWIHRKG